MVEISLQQRVGTCQKHPALSTVILYQSECSWQSAFLSFAVRTVGSSCFAHLKLCTAGMGFGFYLEPLLIWNLHFWNYLSIRPPAQHVKQSFKLSFNLFYVLTHVEVMHSWAINPSDSRSFSSPVPLSVERKRMQQVILKHSYCNMEQQNGTEQSAKQCLNQHTKISASLNGHDVRTGRRIRSLYALPWAGWHYKVDISTHPPFVPFSFAGLWKTRHFVI